MNLRIASVGSGVQACQSDFGLRWLQPFQVYGPFTNEELVGEVLALFRGLSLWIVKRPRLLEPSQQVLKARQLLS